MASRSTSPSRVVALTVVALIVAFAACGVARGAMHPPWTKNCTALNKRYPHGVVKLLARDHTTDEAVTTFKPSTTIYMPAMSHNRGLDRDKDGIACEKA